MDVEREDTGRIGLEARPDVLRLRYEDVRRRTERLAAPLAAEDQQVQSMPDASPTKWHLAHTSWFFDVFVLEPLGRGGDPAFRRLFNSYYHSVGTPPPREARGMFTRPTLREVVAHRRAVDSAVSRLLDHDLPAVRREAILLGTHHEEQHQELLLTDILHAFSRNPLLPAYAPGRPWEAEAPGLLEWFEFDGGLQRIGDDGHGFAFDDERPAHTRWLEPFQLASRLVTNGEFLEFVESGGYDEPAWWMDDGFASCRAHGWEAPLYWRREGAHWLTFSLHGLHPLDEDAPVTHVSWYEADAYARFRRARLPREEEWEAAVREAATDGAGFLGLDVLAPPGAISGRLSQAEGALWQWTASSHDPYPGFRPLPGSLGEYNAKFMSGRRVLRGGSFATPRGHFRPTYRNYFPPEARWQFTGIRLARDRR